MSNKPYYVLLTGGKNNAGDFLIKYRARQLFASIRPDRDIIDIDAWRSRDNELLSIFNNAKAIILMGGPALRPKMYPEIYKALGDIDQITVPIIAMAIGWRAFPGDWVQTHDYKFTEQSLKLLERIENSGYLSSVRDYHSLSVLLNHKFKSFRMTGCAALYDLDFIGKSYNDIAIKKVAFSLGVSFVNSKLHESNVKRLILALKKKYSDKVFEIVFHHSLNSEKFLEVYTENDQFLTKHIQFSDWLKENDIPFLDISGSAENLVSYYNEVDLHIGFRVHAHIYMCSTNRLSMLVTEDGRGKALRDVIGGLFIDTESLGNRSLKKQNRLLNAVSNRIFHLNDRVINEKLTEDIINSVEYEELTNFGRVKKSRLMINELYSDMVGFLNNLP